MSPGNLDSSLCFIQPNGRKWRRSEVPLDESEREKWKSWLITQQLKNEDHGTQSHHFMANTWGNNGNSDRLFSWAPKSLQMVTAAMKSKDTCSWKKSCDQPRQHIKKKKHYFADKGPLSQSHVLSGSQAWMWECTTKKAEFWRIDAFKLWCWRRLSRVPWTARRSDQSTLKESNPEYSL